MTERNVIAAATQMFGVDDLPSTHWMNGGTVISRFLSTDIPIVLAAIKEVGDINLWVEGSTLHGRDLPRDLHSFWAVVKRMQEEGK